MPLRICLQVKPVSTIFFKPRASAYELAYDGQYWTLASEIYEMRSFGSWPWWCLELCNAISGQKRRLIIFPSQLSQFDQWQLSLVFNLLR